MYALTEAWQRRPENDVRAVLDRSARFLVSISIAPIPGHNDMLGIWSLPEITYSGKPPQVKLGGVGLGLAALVSTEKILPGTIPLGDLRKLGHFILYMQNQDGSFFTKYIPYEGIALIPCSIPVCPSTFTTSPSRRPPKIDIFLSYQ